MRLDPCGSRLLVKRLEQETRTAGGLVIPDTADPQRGQARTCVVVAVGPGKKKDDGTRERMAAAPRETVLVGAHAGHEVVVDGEELLIVENDDILAVV